MTLDIETNKQIEFEEEIKTKDSEEQALYCHACDHLITYKKARVEKNESHIHVCINPQGLEYTIACFDDAVGCVTIGHSYDEYSWFEGYTWKISLCKECGEHLGWLFQCNDHFYGLITDRLSNH